MDGRISLDLRFLAGLPGYLMMGGIDYEDQRAYLWHYDRETGLRSYHQ
jgi:hypothetical protein